MIFPFFRGILPPHLAPVTWFFVVVNLFVFIVNLPSHLASQAAVDAYIKDNDFVRTQGNVFSQFVQKNPGKYTSLFNAMSRNALQGDWFSQLMMGSYGARDRNFVEAAGRFQASGDAVALARWRAEYFDFRDAQAASPVHKWGLSLSRPRWTNYVTYQFAHSGFQHILWNMAFLVFFATFLERLIGGSLVTLTYLGAGVVGAVVFAGFPGLSYSPLIGASGSLSGLMALLAVRLWDQPVRFVYWFLPLPGYWGFRELPAWLIIPVYFVPDVAGLLTSIPETGGVAYTAHLGGALFGTAVGLGLRFGWLEAEEPPAPLEESF